MNIHCPQFFCCPRNEDHTPTLARLGWTLSVSPILRAARDSVMLSFTFTRQRSGYFHGENTSKSASILVDTVLVLFFFFFSYFKLLIIEIKIKNNIEYFQVKSVIFR